MFDVPPGEEQTIRWSGDVPLDAKPWNVGLIVGPSGCGKSTVARDIFGSAIVDEHTWQGASVLDDFPADLPLERLAAICQAVGFNTIPAWLRPYHVLSNGERFRVDLARTLIERPTLAVVDEFTSVVDRQVAQIGSHAVQKHVRKAGGQFVAVSCHYDILDWLQPDWVLEPATMTFTWRALQRRPSVSADIQRVDHAAWRLFAPYHYMTAELHAAAQCFVLFVEGRPAAFAGMLFRPHQTARNIWGLSRLVTLPDFQGLGLAFVLTDALGGALAACGQRMHTYPAHPALIRSFDRAKDWSLVKRPGFTRASTGLNTGKLGGRPNAVFAYQGAPWADKAAARQFLGIPSLSRAT
jgi:ABC-type lipoprotein export system ATPase subunit/GNAT superfamily N-acetyltransferase